MKIHINLTVDGFLMQKLKDKRINCSELFENKAREFLKTPEEKAEEIIVNEQLREQEEKIAQEKKAILELCKEFWKSPWGLEAIRNSLRVNILKDGNQLQEGQKEGI